jgi:ADP-heptose:LPS heptosyltransferase
LKGNSPELPLPRLPEGARAGIIRLRSLGDIVLLTPAMEALHAWRPDVRWSVLVEAGYEALLEANPAIHEVLTARNFAQAARLLRARRFPILFNQHAGPRSALLTAASGAATRVCWEKKQFSFVYNLLAPEPAHYYGTNEVHTVEQRMTQFYRAGLPPGPIPAARVYPQSQAVASVQRKLDAAGVTAGQPYAVVRPGAARASKRWPVERFLALASWLREQTGLIPVLNTGPGEEETQAAVREAKPAGAARVDGLSLREVIALIAGASLLVGNDTGPTHIAAATGRPVAVIFGTSNATRWRPWGTRYRLLAGAREEAGGIASVSLDEAKAACTQLVEESATRRPEAARH